MAEPARRQSSGVQDGSRGADPGKPVSGSLLSLRAPRVQQRPLLPSPATARDPHLRGHRRSTARPDRGHVRSPASGARADARRTDHALAHTSGLHARHASRGHAKTKRLLPARGSKTTRERNAAPLVHARSPQRIRDPCTRAGALRRGLAAAGALYPRRSPWHELTEDAASSSDSGSDPLRSEGSGRRQAVRARPASPHRRPRRASGSCRWRHHQPDQGRRASLISASRSGR